MLPSRIRSAVISIEWPTVALAVVIYAGWIAATLLHDRLPPLALALVGGWLVAWHGSLQHEAIHGHPTGSARLNAALVGAPLSLWLPYRIYRRSHLAHHAAERLADPAYDPEARYLPAHAGSLAKAIGRAQATLAGRLTIGPLVEIAGFLAGEAERVRHDAPQARRDWAVHILASAVLLAWLHVVCQMNLLTYLAAFVFPGAALTLIRSFAEHRADGRVAVVERAPLFGLLFLNNNLHAAHHAWPGLPWWRLPGRYRQHREALLAANGGLVYAGYGEIFRRFLFRRHDVLLHPTVEPVA